MSTAVFTAPQGQATPPKPDPAKVKADQRRQLVNKLRLEVSWHAKAEAFNAELDEHIAKLDEIESDLAQPFDVRGEAFLEVQTKRQSNLDALSTILQMVLQHSDTAVGLLDETVAASADEVTKGKAAVEKAEKEAEKHLRALGCNDIDIGTGALCGAGHKLRTQSIAKKQLAFAIENAPITHQAQQVLVGIDAKLRHIESKRTMIDDVRRQIEDELRALLAG